MNKQLKAMYHDGKENFIVDFSNYPDKYTQLGIAKVRGQVIEITICVKGGVRKILSTNLFLEN